MAQLLQWFVQSACKVSAQHHAGKLDERPTPPTARCRGRRHPPVTAVHVAAVRLRVDQRKRGEALSAIEQLMKNLRGAPGCLTCRLVLDADDGTELTLISEWDERHDVDGFLSSCDFLVLKGMRILLRDDPQVVLDQVASRTRLTFKR